MTPSTAQDPKPAREDAPRGPALTPDVERRERRRRRAAARRRIVATCQRAGLDPTEYLASPVPAEPATS
jgi:hypothetical protein